MRIKSWWNWFWQCCTFGRLGYQIVVVFVVVVVGGGGGGGGGSVDDIISLFQIYALFMPLFQLDRLYRAKFNRMLFIKGW
jgi:hypothetical protein